MNSADFLRTARTYLATDWTQRYLEKEAAGSDFNPAVTCSQCICGALGQAREELQSDRGSVLHDAYEFLRRAEVYMRPITQVRELADAIKWFDNAIELAEEESK